MKQITIFIIFILSLNLFSLDVSGTQSGTWSATDNPINLIGDVTVPSGLQLTVEAGAEIIATGNYKITVQGTIMINGAVNDTVRFYGNGGLNWGGLRLENETEQSIIDYCRISNTDDMNDYGIHSVNSPVLINHSYLDDHRKAVGFSSISTTTPSVMEIRNSRISDCEHHGILINDNSNAIVDSCEITRCGLGTQYRGAIQLGLQSDFHTCSPTITNNWIHHNGKQGITMSNLFGYSGMDPHIENNIIENNLTGMYFYSATGTVHNNIIRNNFIAGDANSGAGIMLYGALGNAILTENEITGNFTGLYLTAGATVNLGNVENASDQDDGLNWIHDNVDESGNVYSVYNASSADIMAQNNFWDSFDTAEIDETIIDSNDSGTAGTVTYLPLAQLILNAPQAIDVITNSDNELWDMTVTVTPPEEDIMVEFLGYIAYVDGADSGEIYQSEIIELTGIEPAIEILIEVSALYDVGESTVVGETIENYVFKMPSYTYSLADSTLLLDIEVPQAGSSTDFIEYQIYKDQVALITTTDNEVDLSEYVEYGSEFTIGLSALYQGDYESEVYEESITFVGVEEDMLLIGDIKSYPNPFSISGSDRSNSTTISFSLNTTTKVEVAIFNLKGQLIKKLEDSILEAGNYRYSWDGNSMQENEVASGIYLFVIDAGEEQFSGKLMLLK